MFPLNTILAWNISIIMNKKYDNNIIIIASRAYFLHTKVIPKERGILTLSNEVMKEAIEENGIKSLDLLELSERGIKLAIDEPCIPIQVHAIVPTKVRKM
jgi:hypothetical protein